MSYARDNRRDELKRKNDIPKRRRGIWEFKKVVVTWPRRRREKCAPYGSGFGVARTQLKLKYFGV